MKRKKPETDQALNVTPLIDILSNMVFFLMLSISFLHLRTLSASMTQASDSNDLDTETALTVTVGMDDKGYQAGARDPGAQKASDATVNKDFPMVKGKYDNKGLQMWLRELKLKYPKSDSVILTPDPDISLALVVDAMDACREAPATSGDGMIPTFTKVVLSSINK